uniref:Uncharacterized protein n=1 Tax=Cacopsylla melanoneura TaxID=428564 RepID=A0A8D8TWR3_9HEMI
MCSLLYFLKTLFTSLSFSKYIFLRLFVEFWVSIIFCFAFLLSLTILLHSSLNHGVRAGFSETPHTSFVTCCTADFIIFHFFSTPFSSCMLVSWIMSPSLS